VTAAYPSLDEALDDSSSGWDSAVIATPADTHIPIAQRIAEAGAHVVMASRNVDKLQIVADELTGRGLSASAEPLDQGDPASIHALRDAVLEKQGRVDVLVNNAVLRPTKGWDDDLDAFGQSMAVNVTGCSR